MYIKCWTGNFIFPQCSNKKCQQHCFLRFPDNTCQKEFLVSYDFVKDKLGIYFEEIRTKTVWTPGKRIIGNAVFLAINKLLTTSRQNLRLETRQLTLFSTVSVVSKILFGSSCENLLVFNLPRGSVYVEHAPAYSSFSYTQSRLSLLLSWLSFLCWFPRKWHDE